MGQSDGKLVFNVALIYFLTLILPAYLSYAQTKKIFAITPKERESYMAKASPENPRM